MHNTHNYEKKVVPMHSSSLAVGLLLLALLPSIFVQYRVFVPLLEPCESRRLAKAFILTYAAIVLCVVFVFSQGIVGVAWISFKDTISLHAIPYLLLGLLYVPAYRLQYVFVLGMQGLCIVALLTFIMNLDLLIIPSSQFFYYIVPFLLAYMLSYIMLVPLLLKFFRSLFITYHMVDMLSFWKYAAWLPVSLILYSAVLAHTNEPMSRDYLIPRILQAVSGICIAVTLYLGTRKMHYAIGLKRENATLLTQMEMFADYTKMLQSSQRRMSIYRHDTRHQLRLLSKLIQEKDDTASLALLETLTQELAQTRPYHWGKNTCIRKTLLPLIEKAREDGIPVMADLSLAPHIPFEQELAQAAARLVGAAITVSLAQDKTRSSITVIARQTDTTVMLLVGHRQTAPVTVDAEGRPQDGPYAEVIPVLRQFMMRHQGVGQYTCKKGWIVANLRIPCKGGAAV